MLCLVAWLTERLQDFHRVFPRLKPAPVVDVVNVESGLIVGAFYALPFVAFKNGQAFFLPAGVFEFFCVCHYVRIETSGPAARVDTGKQPKVRDPWKTHARDWT